MPNTFSTSEIADLIDKHLRNCLKTDEEEKLQRWLDEHEDNLAYFKRITAPGVIEGMALEALKVNMAAARRKFHARQAKR